MWNRFIYIGLFVFGFVSFSLSQKQGISLAEYEAQGNKLATLDNLYISAVDLEDPSKALFKTQGEVDEWFKDYIELIHQLGDFLIQNGFKWDKTYRCFNRVYFNEEGKIDLFIYNFNDRNKDKNPTAEQQKEFERLLNVFIGEYVLEKPMNIKFVQSGPIKFNPDHQHLHHDD